MFRQNLLVISIVVIGVTGCHHHHRHHPHAFRPPGLHGLRSHHHNQCRTCGRRSRAQNVCCSSLFPGDPCGQCGEVFQEGCCGDGFMGHGSCGSCQSCNTCDDCGGFPGSASCVPGTGCSSFGMQMNPPPESFTGTPRCNCDRQNSADEPRSSNPLGSPQEALPPVPGDAHIPPADANSNVDGEAARPAEEAPAALPPIDPVSWKIPRLP